MHVPVTPTVSRKMLALARAALVFGIIFNPWTRFPYTFMLIIAVICLLCWLETGTLTVIGLRNNLPARTFITAFLAGFLLIEAGMDLIIQPLIGKLLHEPADYSYFSILEGKNTLYVKYLVYTWISAAAGEEILFRGFLFYQLSKLFPASRWRAILVVFLAAGLFAIPHYYLGFSGMLVTFCMGIAFGILYLRTGNLWVCILVHGAIDTLFLTLAWLGKTGYYEWVNRELWGM